MTWKSYPPGDRNACPFAAGALCADGIPVWMGVAFFKAFWRNLRTADIFGRTEGIRVLTAIYS